MWTYFKWKCFTSIAYSLCPNSLKPTGQDHLTGYEVMHSQAYYAWPHWGRSKETNEQKTAIAKEYIKMKNTIHTSLKSNVWCSEMYLILYYVQGCWGTMSWNSIPAALEYPSTHHMLKICKCFTVTIACRDTLCQLEDWRHY